MQPFSFLIFIPLVSFICYCFLLGIIVSSRKNKIVKYYAAYIVAMIVWSLGSFVMRTNFPPSTLFWNRILCIGLISMPVVFYHFTLVLTETKNQFNKLAFGYCFAGFLIISNFAGLIMYDADVVNNEFIYTLGPLASVMAIYSLCYLILAFTNIIEKVKSNVIPFARVKFILIGLVLVIIGGLLNLFPSLGKYPFDIISNTINAFFIAYSIYRYRFLEIHIIVKKGIAYSLYTLALTGVYIVAIFTVQLIIIRMIGSSNITLTLAMAFILALVFQPLKNSLQKWIDVFFYKDKLNHQILLRDFSEKVNNILDLGELKETLLEAVNKGLKPQNANLILRQGKEGYSVANSTHSPSIDVIRYRNDHPIVQWFNQGKLILTMSEIDSSPFFTGLWSVEKKQLHEMGTELIVPIKLREQLIGFMILSEKKGGEAYSQDEMDLLFTLMNNAAIVIENAKMYQEAKYQAVTDGLTKLNNHRYFQEILSKCISEKPYEIFSVAMIDVDLFKLYNDLHGHSAGDRALIKIAEVIRKSTRPEDIIARYGGEEFAVIFPDIQEKESLKAIEKIRRAVENCFYSSNEFNEFLTISVGVASYPKDGTSSEEILDKADSAMYAAKRSGRNQCVIYSRKDTTTVDYLNNHELERIQDSIKTAYFSAIYALAATIDAKDHYTYGHSENVSSYAVALAKAAGFDEERIDIVKNAGLLHDIGKIGVPESILTKTEALTPEELEVMKRHVDMSISIIKHIPNLIKVIPAIMSHHERYDGTGYPRGMKGENIPMEGRCLCIVDAFDAMTTDRPYRRALSYEAALLELKNNRGSQFDPELTDIFISLFEKGRIGAGVA